MIDLIEWYVVEIRAERTWPGGAPPPHPAAGAEAAALSGLQAAAEVERSPVPLLTKDLMYGSRVVDLKFHSPGLGGSGKRSSASRGTAAAGGGDGEDLALGADWLLAGAAATTAATADPSAPSPIQTVLRSKGFLWIDGNPRRAVFHGVNNRFTLLWDRLWEKGETRNSQLVFIGKEIDEARIRQHLEQCIVK